MKAGHADSRSIGGNLGALPCDGKEDGRVPQHTEVVRVVRVLGDVLARGHQVLSECLLQPQMKLVAPSRPERRQV